MNTLPQQSPIVQDPANRELSKSQKRRLEEQIERHGHGGVFGDHKCRCCESSWNCASVVHCRKPEESFCKECATVEFVSDVERNLDFIASHMREYAELDPTMLAYSGILKGLISRAQELGRWS